MPGLDGINLRWKSKAHPVPRAQLCFAKFPISC